MKYEKYIENRSIVFDTCVLHMFDTTWLHIWSVRATKDAVKAFHLKHIKSFNILDDNVKTEEDLFNDLLHSDLYGIYLVHP